MNEEIGVLIFVCVLAVVWGVIIALFFGGLAFFVSPIAYFYFVVGEILNGASDKKRILLLIVHIMLSLGLLAYAVVTCGGSGILIWIVVMLISKGGFNGNKNITG